MKRILPLLLSLLLLTGCASNQPGQYPDGVPSSLTAVRWPEAPHAEDYDAQRSLRADVTPEQLESLNPLCRQQRQGHPGKSPPNGKLPLLPCQPVLCPVHAGLHHRGRYPGPDPFRPGLG